MLALPKPSRFGRPRADTCRVFEALLFVLHTGIQWKQSQRLIGDKTYDVDALDETLAELGIEMIAPHRKNRRPENVTQGGRPLRRYRRRWRVERTIAWLGNHRRLLTRWEKHAALYSAFATLGCLMIALRHLPLT